MRGERRRERGGGREEEGERRRERGGERSRERREKGGERRRRERGGGGGKEEEGGGRRKERGGRGGTIFQTPQQALHQFVSRNKMKYFASSSHLVAGLMFSLKPRPPLQRGGLKGGPGFETRLTYVPSISFSAE